MEEQQNEDSIKQAEIEKEERMRAEARAKAEKEIQKEEEEKAAKKIRIGCGAFLGIIILIIILGVMFSNGNGEKPILTQEEQRQQTIEAQFSAWDGSHIKLTKIIKTAMNDPKSYEHVETRYWDMGDHLIISTTFTGKNAFGGTVKNTVKAKVSLDGESIEVLEQF